MQQPKANTLVDALRIEHGTGPEFDRLTESGKAKWHDISIAVRNSGNGWLTGCALHLVNVDPPGSWPTPVQLHPEQFELNNPGQTRVLPFLVKNEGENDDGVIRVRLPFPAGFMSSDWDNRLTNGKHILTLEARARECQPHRQRFSVWVDETGKLQLAPVNTAADANIGEPFEWMTIKQAIARFCDPEWVWRCNRYNTHFESGMERCHKLEREMQENYSAVPGGGWNDRPDDLKKFTELQEELQRQSTVVKFCETGLRDTWGILREAICEKLASAELIAQGFAEPYSGGQQEHRIRSSEWRILTVDPANDAAVKKSDPTKVVYSAVQIARIKSHDLEIGFDESNPAQRYWSIEQAKDAEGKPLPPYWEYRAQITNKSQKTLRNVKATVEAVGDMPTRGEPSYFDINKQPLINLNPGDRVLAILRRWYNPPIVVGMVCGGAYGPIKMTVSADDVAATSKLFWFEPESTPMLKEISFT